MAKKYYHNIDKDIYNETDFIEFMDRFSTGDTIFWTEGGNAILNKPTPTQIQSMEDEYEEWQIQQEDGGKEE